ncbi:MAG TPA: TIGR04551 family protein, partial [Vulgatibacter sp.]|nr:TIGR04551 family protein [Vulgatibacter sp.]
PPPAEDAPASPSGSPLSPEELQAIREEIRAQLEEELQDRLDAAKEEMRDEVRAAVISAGAAQEWDVEWEEVRPKLELFEVNGYFRTRMDLFYRFDLDTPPDPSGFGIFPIDPQSSARHTMAGANMRLRLDPTLNVSEEVRIRGQVDVFDNLLFGSTPAAGWADGVGNQKRPWVIDSNTLAAPEFGWNAIRDSIVAKRVWGEARTPIGELRFGRMADHFGMGVFTNDGNCLDCDDGNTVDRFLFAVKIANHVIAPALDFISEGPTSADPSTPWPNPQPFDRTQADDARQWVISILRRDSDDEIRKMRVAGRDTFVNYGLRLAWRTQHWDAPALEVGGPGDGNAGGGSPEQATLGSGAFVPRDAWTLTPDVWFRLLYKKYRLEFEFVTVQGQLGNRFLPEGGNRDEVGENQELTFSQFGAVMQNEVKLVDDKLSLGLEIGFASGDGAPGFGNLPGRRAINDTHDSPFTVRGDWDGPQFNCAAATCSDKTIDNFRFNSDYRVDLILFREILGTVTDALYFKPSVRYLITEGLDVNFAVVYSQANARETTPTHKRPLGVELDAGINYVSDDGFISSIAYGVLFPLSGLDQLDASGSVVSARSAQTVRGFFGIVY